MAVSQPDARQGSAVEETRHKIASLQHLDLRKHSIDELAERIRDLLQGHPLRLIEFGPGLLLYRGKACTEPPTHLQHVSYPPAELVTADQRANRAGQPMFYCSATWHPPFFEASVQPKDQIVISRWQTQQPLRLASFGYADVCADDPHSDREKALAQALAQLPAVVQPIAEFLTKAFTRSVHDDNHHHYRLSVAIAEACELGTAFDGLLYPSAAMPSPAHNLALHPSCLDTGKLRLQYVEYLTVNRVETETIDVQSHDFANSVLPDGRLKWLGRPGNWVLREGGISTDCRYDAGQWRVQGPQC
ncbi:RES family NAD+ phosphorylase [Hymenobacter cellulosilyticus]|uniref:RES family NAD+ phosphorylase n=1 Tax=Hymenobacter cellulosilyticus TaxID=2932248 RepID=A0A8T9Q363_9BACT|nr:RES family NAD+ phosphorylase [Hymenobacter cellulosilyticus]UOQ71897.1 RES family NAD+ phosphorylase [Hymenobacter cellulosilyticus]